MSQHLDINKEIEDFSSKLVKSQKLTIAELAQELGKEGLKKAMAKMTSEQLAVFKEELAQLKKHIPGVPDKKYDDCVSDVKAKEGDKVNAYAVCHASLDKSDANPEGPGEVLSGIGMAARDEEETEQKKKEKKDMGKDLMNMKKGDEELKAKGDGESKAKEEALPEDEQSAMEKRKKKEEQEGKLPKDEEDMKKAFEDRTSEPFLSTDRGGKFEMNEDHMERQNLLDELIAMDMMAAEDMRTIRHQGGPEKSYSWEGTEVADPAPQMDWEADAHDLKEPKSENKHDQIADKIIELNKLGEMSHEERMEMREKIMMILESLMARQLEKSVTDYAIDSLSAKLGLPSGKLHTIYNKMTEMKKAEGSRGGKIIGHTKSGKPIYEAATLEHHGKFSKEDHVDAMHAHLKEIGKYEKKHGRDAQGNIRGDHDKVALHSLAWNRHDEASGYEGTKSRKHDVRLNPNPKKHPLAPISEGVDHKGESMYSGQKMKKSLDPFYDHMESNEEFYKSDAPNPFEYRKIGQNCHWGVDSYIEAEEKAVKANLEKSSFLYPDTDKPAGVQAASAQDLIEKGLDMDELNVETAMINRGVKQTYNGVTVVKSFNDASMEALFAETDTWGQPLKKSEEKEEGKDESDEEKKKREAAKEKLMEMEEKEHGEKDPEKLVEDEKKEHMEKSKGSLKKDMPPLNPAGVASIGHAFGKSEEDDHEEDEHDEDIKKCGGYEMLAKELEDMKDDSKDEDMEKAYIGFKKLESKLAGKVKNPAAVSASIGRKKYGAAGMAKMAAAGRAKKAY